MDVFDAVRTVLAVRQYQDRSVPPEAVRKIVEAGRLSATSMNAQPLRFVVVDDKDIIGNLASIARSGPYISQAPLAVVIATEKTRFAESDAGRAVQSMVLTAWAEGIGSNWVGYYGLDDAKRLLGIPDTLDVLAIIPFGYPAKPGGKGRKTRKPASEVVHHNRFGRPL